MISRKALDAERDVGINIEKIYELTRAGRSHSKTNEICNSNCAICLWTKTIRSNLDTIRDALWNTKEGDDTSSDLQEYIDDLEIQLKEATDRIAELEATYES